MKRFALLFLCFTLSCFATTPYYFKEENGLLHFFDPEDRAYENEGVPFLVMQLENQAQILELAKTANFSGKEILAIAKKFQKTTDSTTLHLTDTSLSLPCDQDGIWCKDEALMDLKMSCIFVNGITYYQSEGAEVNDLNFFAAADYIHNKNLTALITDLEQLIQIDSAKIMSTFIKKVAKFYRISTKNHTIGDLAKCIYYNRNQSLYCHKLWHEFYNKVIGEQKGFFIEYVYYAIQSNQIPESTLSQLLAIVKKEYNDLLKMGYKFGENCNDYWVLKFQKKLETCNHFPALFLISRASNQIIENTVRTKHFINDPKHLKKLLQLDFQVKKEHNFKLVPEYGIANWFISKNKVQQTKEFEFK